MWNRLILASLLTVSAGLTACESQPTADAPAARAADHAAAPAPAKPLAFVSSEPVTAADLQPALLEAAGGQVLSERVLGVLIDRALGERGVRLTEADLAAERELVLAALSEDEDQAARLLRELRQRRGLGEQRFAAMLRRNAGLRRLVQGQVKVTDEALRQAYDLAHGPRYQARLILVDNLQEAARIREQLQQGVSFADLAVEHSTDSSAQQGGLLPLISPSDPSYPQVIREAVTRLTPDGPGAISDVIALDGNFALLRLERKIEGDQVQFDDVKEELAGQVQRRLEQMRMQQLARQMLAETKVTVLEPALSESWQQQKQLLLTP